MSLQLDFQIISAIVFILILTVFVYVKRKKLEVQKILFPFLYFILYRTKLGIKFMDRIARKAPKFWKVFSVSGVVVGFLGMAFIAVNLVFTLWQMFTQPEAPGGAALVLPVPVEGAIYVPFFYWILCIFIIALVHEFSHGIIARLYGVKVKSSGFAFFSVILPIIPAAFVEPDEEKLEKKSKMQQLGVFAAGPFSNIILAFIALGIIVFAINPIASMAVNNTGINIVNVLNETPASEAGLQQDDLISRVDNQEINTIDDFTAYIDEKNPGQEIIVYSNRTTTDLVLGEKPGAEDQPYVGINFQQGTEIKQSFVDKYGEVAPKIMYWIYEFFYWLFLLNFGIGLFNLVPLGPVDGGRMMKTVLSSWFSEKRANKIWKYISYVFLAIILYMLISPWLGALPF